MTDADALHLDWIAPGPVADRFMASSQMIQIINGPVGSGKTTAMLMKDIRLAAAQAPSRRHRARGARGELLPVRQVRVACIRDTYRDLWRSTLPSWFKRVPREAGEFVGAENAPARHRLNFLPGDGTVVDFQIEFGAFGDNAIEDFMRGYEVTWWNFNELDLLPPQALAYAINRAGRFPEMDDVGPTWRGVLADCNAPEFEGWLYSGTERDDTGRMKPGIFMMSPAEREAMGCDLFIQPGGREPGAENLQNLPPGYYTPTIGQTRAYVARMIDNRPGYSEAGMPAQPEFSHTRHVAAQEIEPVNAPLVIGLDPRTVPSAVFMQRMPNGQRRITDELQGEQNMGPRRFGALVAQLLHDRYGFLRPQSIRGMADPSAAYGVDRDDGDKNWIEIVAAIAGIRIDGAPTNDPAVRREALEMPLKLMSEGKPMLVISPRCTTLIAGLASGYRYRKMAVPGATRYAPEVEKNHYADLCEAAEYACLSDGADLDIRERRQHQQNATAQREAQSDYPMFGGARDERR